MKAGRLHLAGPHAWPDHVLNYEVGGLVFGAVVQIRSWAFGLELQRSRHSRAKWLLLYVGPWAFEAYLDSDRKYELV